MIKNINVVIVYVEDQQKMLDFWVDTMGFEKTTDGEMWPGARWIEVKPKGAETGLVLGKASDFNSEPNTGYPATFASDDLDTAVAKLRDAGVEVTDIAHEAWGSYCQVTDPEGRQFLLNNVQ